MISEFKTIPKAVYYVQTADGCTVLDADGDTLAEIAAPGGYFPGIAAADGGPGTVTFSAPVKRVVGPFDLAPQLLLTLLGQLGGNAGLPAGYKRVEYLQSTGSQRITTNLNSSMVEEIELEVIGSSAVYVLIQVGYETVLSQNYSKIRADLGAYCINNELNGLSTGKNIVTFSYKTYTLKINNEEKVVDQDVGNEKFYDKNQYWFNKDDLAWGGRNTALGNCKILKDHKTHLDIIPCLDETGAPCMFDLVSQKAFYNTGRGDFTYPTESTTYSLRRVLPAWGKLTENGLRRLYHAPASFKGELCDYSIENGFKPIIEPEKPEAGYWVSRWRETDAEIVLEWVETEPPMSEVVLPMKEESQTTE